MKKLRVAVLFGGRSGEHEISLRSAASVIQNLDSERFDVIPVGIAKDGTWHLSDPSRLDASGDSHLVTLSPSPNQKFTSGPEVDVVFPVIHGPLCEDGTIQGLLELAELPYVGAGVLGSAIGMDKEVAKRLARDSGLPMVPFVSIKTHHWKSNPKKWESEIAKNLKYPVFIKPANMGSSVGVHKVKSAAELGTAVEDALRYDIKVLIEKAIDAREIEVAVLENLESGKPPIVSPPGEVIPKHEFYSYEAKYLDENGALLKIPAELTEAQSQEAMRISSKVFESIECEGMGRVDLFLDRNTGKFYFNEINTIPGFTSISMFPKMMEAGGISYKELLSHLIDLALKRHRERKRLLREYQPGF